MSVLPGGAVRRILQRINGEGLSLVPKADVGFEPRPTPLVAPVSDDLLATIDFLRGVEVTFLGRGPQFEEIPE